MKERNLKVDWVLNPRPRQYWEESQQVIFPSLWDGIVRAFSRSVSPSRGLSFSDSPAVHLSFCCFRPLHLLPTSRLEWPPWDLLCCQIIYMHAWTQGKSQRAEAGKFGVGWGWWGWGPEIGIALTLISRLRTRTKMFRFYGLCI